jgi:hypothetical protein
MCRAILGIVLYGFLASPGWCEEITYYIWVDDEGVTHAEDSPPRDRDYETRTIEVDTTTVPGTTGTPREARPSRDAAAPSGESADGAKDTNPGPAVRDESPSGFGKAVIIKETLPNEPELRELPRIPGASIR